MFKKIYSTLRLSTIRRYSAAVKLDSQEGFLKFIQDRIRLTGPLTVADYMRIVQTKPDVGYYMTQQVFGAKGDFITSPELSQMFGELLGVWTVAELRRLGHRGKWQLIELGPGTGAMMADMLATLKQLKMDFSQLSVQMVEVSKKLAEKQLKLLCPTPVQSKDESSAAYQQGITTQGCPIQWHSDIKTVPDGFSVLIAHEFLDALPIHKFEKSSKGWREVLIDCNPSSGQLNFVLSRVETISQRAFLTPKIIAAVPSGIDHVEICPGAMVHMESLAERLNGDGGVALIIDYGHTGEKGDTFRGFRSHKVVDPLQFPGVCDVTADVNFAIIKESVKDKLMVSGPIEQREFLQNLGIDLRLKKLLAQCHTDQQRNYLRRSYEVLTSTGEMGSRFKVLGLYPKILQQFPQLSKSVGFHPISN